MTEHTHPITADATFAVVPTWVLDAPVTANAVRLYGVLRRYADQRGVAWPSRQTLATRLRCSRDTIDRALRELVGIGALTITRRVGPDGAPTSSLYVVHTLPGEPVDNLQGVAAGMRPGGRTDAAGGGRTDAAQNQSQMNQSHEGNRARARERSTWCGSCDEQTRLEETTAGPRRCPLCHPLAVPRF